MRAGALLGAWAFFEAMLMGAGITASLIHVVLWPILAATAFVLLVGNPAYKLGKRSYDRRYGYLHRRVERDR